MYKHVEIDQQNWFVDSYDIVGATLMTIGLKLIMTLVERGAI